MKYIVVVSLCVAAAAGGWSANAKLHPQTTLFLHGNSVLQNAKFGPWNGSMVDSDSSDLVIRNVDFGYTKDTAITLK